MTDKEFVSKIGKFGETKNVKMSKIQQKQPESIQNIIHYRLTNN